MASHDTGRGEVLFLAHRIPYPPNKGDKIRSWRLFQRLAARFDVHLAAFVDDPVDFQHKEFLEGQCASLTLVPLDPAWATARSARALLAGAPLSFSYYDDRRMRQAIDAVRARDLRLEVAFSSTMAPYLKTPRGDRPQIVDLCDADSAKWAAYADKKAPPMAWVYAREAARLRAAETEILNGAAVSFAISADEAATLNAAPGVVRAADWFGNGVDLDYFHPPAAADRDPAFAADMVFVGALDYWANHDAVTWCVEEIWPLVRARRPEARFSIVGRKPPTTISGLHGRDGICVAADVADVRPYVWNAKIAVAPMRIARGVQNKVLEAMACGAASVVTGAAGEGIAFTPGDHAAVADDPGAFAGAILELLDDPGAIDAMGAAASAHMASAYSWDAQLSRFDAALERLGVVA